MKEIKEEFKTYKTKYQAIDGQQFDSQEECLKYEASAKGVLKAKLDRLIVGKANQWDFLCGYEDNDVFALNLKTQEDADVVMQLLLLEHPYLTEDRFKDKLNEYQKVFNEAIEQKCYMLMGLNCEGELYFMGNVNHFIDNLKNIGKQKEE